MKDPNVEALNKRTRTDVLITLLLSAVFAVRAVIKLFRHAPDAACSSMFLFVIFLLTGLIFVDIRKNGKPFAKSVITKMRTLAVTVCISGYVSQFVDCIAEGIRNHGGEAFPFTFYLDDRHSVYMFLLGTLIGILSEIFVYGHALQNDMDQIA
ncbi:MAG: hypothetical protein IJM46_14765 [Oscillospiraceae bacterium]|nr:hypothetical protein [Oscillospiraceae bacterium]